MDSFTRTAPFVLERAEGDGDGLTLIGYAAMFEDWTHINSAREGVFDEMIARGAFTDSLKSRTPKLQFDHGQHALIGSMPLGNIKRMIEDERGLYIEARLHDNWMIHPVRDAIASGAIDGMSFRFSVPDGGDTWDRSGSTARRTITRADVFEVGPVVFPAYASTSVGVRSEELDRLFSLPDDERLSLARALVLASPVAVSQGEATPDTTDPEGVAPGGEDVSADAVRTTTRPEALLRLSHLKRY